MRYKKEMIISIGELMAYDGSRNLTPVFAGQSFPVLINVTEAEFKSVKGDIDAMKELAISKLNKTDAVVNKITDLFSLLETIKADANDKYATYKNEIVFQEKDIKLELSCDRICVFFNNGKQHLEYEVYQKIDRSFNFNWID